MKKFAFLFLLPLLALLALTTQINAQTSTPKLEIVTPADGQTIYGNRIPVLFSIENFTLVESKDKSLPSNSQGHILIWLDDQLKTADTATKVTQDTFTFADVIAGDHIITAELVNADGKSITPTQSKAVNFKTEPLTSPAKPKEAGFDKNTTLVILLIVALVIAAAWWYTKDEEPLAKTNKSKVTPKKIKRRKT